MAETTSESALARKRRIAMRNHQRSPSSSGDEERDPKRPRVMDAGEEDASAASVDAAANVADPVTSKPKPHITGIKKQSRYDPGVPMTREELKAWRKEARRVRNRESAAESRKKNRQRITELESQVDFIKTKYAAALKFIVELETRRSGQEYSSFTPPALLRQDLMELREGGSEEGDSSRPDTPVTAFPFASRTITDVQTVSPPLSPTNPPVLMTDEELFLNHHHHPSPPAHCPPEQEPYAQHKTHQHIIDMISRPIAAKIPPGADASVEGNISCNETMMTMGNEGNDDVAPDVSSDPRHLIGESMVNAAQAETNDLAFQGLPFDIVTEYSKASSTTGSSTSSEDMDNGCNSLCADSFLDDQGIADVSELGEFLMEAFDGTTDGIMLSDIAL